MEACLFGTTTLILPFLALPILLLVYLGVDLFGANFMKLTFSFFKFFNL